MKGVIWHTGSMELSWDHFEELIARDAAAGYALLRELAAQVTTLAARVKELEERLGGNSRNSSRPPSSDPPGTPKRPSRGERERSGRRVGGQPGHPGHTAHFVEPGEVDEVVEHRLDRCTACGGEVAVEGVQRRQVIEVRPRLIEVTEHRAEVGCCTRCGRRAKAVFPEGVRAPVQYGPRLKAVGVYLSAYHLVPARRTVAILGDVLGCPISVGTLQTALEQGAASLAPVEAQVADALAGAPVLHADETGVSVNGQRQWLHVASTANLTHLAVNPRRGHTATEVIGVLPRATGRLVHDHWVGYWHYPTAHALCNAHHLRELTAVEERDPDHAWATDLKTLLRTMKREIATRQAEGETAIRAPDREAFHQQYLACLDAGDAGHPRAPLSGRRGATAQSKTRNLLTRLRTRQSEVLAFLHDWRVPFDNNQAERDLRMVKVQQKISGCFRTPTGAATFCRWRGYLATLRKQGAHLLSAIEATVRGQPIIPQLTS